MRLAFGDPLRRSWRRQAGITGAGAVGLGVLTTLPHIATAHHPRPHRRTIGWSRLRDGAYDPESSEFAFPFQLIPHTLSLLTFYLLLYFHTTLHILDSDDRMTLKLCWCSPLGLVNIIFRIVSPALESAHGSSSTGQLEWRGSAFTMTEANTGLRSWLKYDTMGTTVTVSHSAPTVRHGAIDRPPHFQLRLSAMGILMAPISSRISTHNKSFITKAKVNILEWGVRHSLLPGLLQ